MKFLIIADDLTGALDTGVQLSKNGIHTTVVADTSNLDAVDTSVDVLVINAGSRHLSPKGAYEATTALLKQFANSGVYIYIKTDSALRGNISAEFAATLDYTGRPLCFVPAFPDLKRTTVNSTAYVDDVLLENSVFRNDPRTPMHQSYIPNIISSPYPVKCISIYRENMHSFEPAAIDSSKLVWLFDCENNEQMDAIADLIDEKKCQGLTAGCAGFASTFASHIDFDKSPLIDDAQKGPALYVSGSANAVTFRQLKYAKEHGFEVISLAGIILDVYDNITKNNSANANDADINFDREEVFGDVINRVVSLLENNNSVILATAASKDELIGDASKVSTKTIHDYIAECTTFLVKSVLDRTDISNLVVFGGDMVAAILKEMDCHEVEARGEIVSGVPICVADFCGRTFRMVTKSGGFGVKTVIKTIDDYIRKE